MRDPSAKFCRRVGLERKSARSEERRSASLLLPWLLLVIVAVLFVGSVGSGDGVNSVIVPNGKEVLNTIESLKWARNGAEGNFRIGDDCTGYTVVVVYAQNCKVFFNEL